MSGMNLQLDIEPEEQLPAQEKSRLIEPGWHRDLTNEEYHRSYGISSTKLKKFITKTPAHIEYERLNPTDPTKNMQLGTAVHTLVLEPESFDKEIKVMPEFNLRTVRGREDRDFFLERHAGYTIITAEQRDTAMGMAESVAKHEEASMLLDGSIRESSIYWWYKSMDPDDNTEYREMFKVRPDALGVAHPVCMDLKSCDDATFTGFQRSILRFGYHVSAAMYLEGLNQCDEALKAMGIFACRKFVFICVENKPPYIVDTYELSPEFLDIGKTEYRRCAYKHKKAKDAGWPKPRGIRVMDPPSYAEKLWIV